MAALKGGVAKTTTAIHLAAFFHKHDETVLIDFDKNESALTWARLGKLPFPVCPLEGATKYIRKAVHVIIDTQARPTNADLEAIAQGCDLLILPTTPKALDIDALIKTTDVLKELNANFKVLLTMVPPPRRRPSSRDIKPHLKEEKARFLLEQEEIPTFNGAIYQYTAFERAPLMGVTVDQYPDKYAKTAWNCYKKIGEEIING
ncbi:MAG: ParA family protein [Crocosphaera sp.]